MIKDFLITDKKKEKIEKIKDFIISELYFDYYDSDLIDYDELGKKPKNYLDKISMDIFTSRNDLIEMMIDNIEDYSVTKEDINVALDYLIKKRFLKKEDMDNISYETIINLFGDVIKNMPGDDVLNKCYLIKEKIKKLENFNDIICFADKGLQHHLNEKSFEDDYNNSYKINVGINIAIIALVVATIPFISPILTFLMKILFYL